MLKQFKEQYPTTQVIINATEIYIEQHHLPELQQMTFSNYKNENTFKALIESLLISQRPFSESCVLP